MAVVLEARVLHAFKSRDFRLLWSGQTVSLIGDAAFLVAIGWRTFTLTGKASSLGLVLMLEALAMLTTILIGGALADRYERRALMIASDLARFVVVAGLAAVDATGHLSFGLLLAFAVAVGLSDGFFHPAFGGIVPLVVEQPLLASANALISIARQSSFMIGPALAAAVYGPAGSATVFALDAGSFLFSAGLLYLARPRAFEPEPAEGMLREIFAGARYVARIPWLWISIAIAAFVLMVAMAPFQVLVPKLVDQHFGLGVGAYGLLFTLQAAGMLLGTLVFGQVNPRRRRIVVAYVGFAINDVCMVTLALSPWYSLAAAMSLARGAFIGFGIGVWETMLMELVPENRLSRVISLDYFGSLGLTPVGYALAAAVSGLFSPSLIIAAGGATAAVLWTAPLSLRRVRSAA